MDISLSPTKGSLSLEKVPTVKCCFSCTCCIFSCFSWNPEHRSSSFMKWNVWSGLFICNSGVHLIPALPTSVLTFLPPSPHSTPSHFLLGNRWETGRRGNEQEERQTLTVTTVKETADIAPRHVDALSYRNWVVSHSAVGYKHGDLLLSGWILRVTALTLWWLSVTLTEQTHNTPGLTFKTLTLSSGEFYFSWDLPFYADLHMFTKFVNF